jgi:hypothetical protein
MRHEMAGEEGCRYWKVVFRWLGDMDWLEKSRDSMIDLDWMSRHGFAGAGKSAPRLHLGLELTNGELHRLGSCFALIERYCELIPTSYVDNLSHLLPRQ